jgi:hypothetical protein
MVEKVAPIRRPPLPTIEGIEFDDAACTLIKRLVAQLKSTGDVAVYGLPNMHKHKGEIRLAHRGPDINHKNGRGVFARLIPSTLGVTYTQRRKTFASKRTNFTSANFEDILKATNARRAVVKDRLKGTEKVTPDKPGTVSGGQFESKRRKH